MKREWFIDTAASLGQQSKCVSKKVGSLFVKDSRIISMGYNGSPPGHKNCNDTFQDDFLSAENYTHERRIEHREWSLKHEIHAEMNALAFAARNGINVEGSILYNSLEPCNDCLKNLTAAGVAMVVFKEIYYEDGRLIDVEFWEYLQNNMPVKMLNNNGEVHGPRNTASHLNDVILYWK